MREIKFRAWDIEANQMFYNLVYVIKENSLLDINGFFKKDNIVPMQYTGQKDKNGKEIWEGDIVKQYDYVKEVIWNEQYSCFDFKYQNGPKTFHNIVSIERSGQCEVIGNIYENPELRVIKND